MCVNSLLHILTSVVGNEASKWTRELKLGVFVSLSFTNKGNHWCRNMENVFPRGSCIYVRTYKLHCLLLQFEIDC